jgi:hypothetical protein
MEELHRNSPRYEVSIHLSLSGKSAGSLHVHDISAGGFLGRGAVAVSVGEAIQAVIHVSPLSGERDVKLACTVANVQGTGESTLVGVRIDGFGSGADKDAYLAFLKELAEDAEQLS